MAAFDRHSMPFHWIHGLSFFVMCSDVTPWTAIQKSWASVSASAYSGRTRPASIACWQVCLSSA